LVRGDGKIAIHSLSTGKQLWTQDLGLVAAYEPAIAPLVARHVAYFATDDGFLAIDLRTHLELWRYVVGATPAAQPVVMSGIFYFTASFAGEPSGARVGALDAATGKPRWYYDNLGQTISGVAIGSKMLAVSITGASSPLCCVVRTFDRRRGYDLGGFQPVGTRISAQPVVIGGVVYTVSDTGAVTASRVVPKTDPPNRTEWQRDAGSSQFPAITQRGSRLLVAAGEVAKFGLDGSSVWTAPVRDAYFPAPAVNGLVVAVSRADGRLFVVDARDGRVVTTVKDGTSQAGVTLQRDSMVTASERGVVTGYRVSRR
jgi:outer membrane protein assembly factor BamB